MLVLFSKIPRFLCLGAPCLRGLSEHGVRANENAATSRAYPFLHAHTFSARVHCSRGSFAQVETSYWPNLVGRSLSERWAPGALRSCPAAVWLYPKRPSSASCLFWPMGPERILSRVRVFSATLNGAQAGRAAAVIRPHNAFWLIAVLLVWKWWLPFVTHAGPFGALHSAQLPCSPSAYFAPLCPARCAAAFEARNANREPLVGLLNYQRIEKA